MELEQFNVLILSAGRRVELTKLFKKAAVKQGNDSKIIVGDASEDIPARYFADEFHKLPRIDSGEYIETIIEITNNRNVGLIVPTIDTELILLSEYKVRIETETKAKVLISDPEVIKVCRDKITTQNYLTENGFDMPKMLEINEVKPDDEFPMFIKPKSGSSSIGAYKVNNYSDLSLYSEVVEEPVLQEFVDGEEYTVDVFLDFESTVITVVPRLRLATRSGEISKGQIIKDNIIIDEVIRLMNTLKPIGHITVQLFKTKDNKIKFIEINPRFGGGAPMSIQSGADSPQNLFRILNGETLKYNLNYQDQLLFLRFDDSICLDANSEVINFD